jgi:hypothetical protein
VEPVACGPELDFLLDGDPCVVFGEVKWKHGGLGERTHP